MRILILEKNTKMFVKLYKYGVDKLPMKVLKNLHEVIDFVNPNNENLRQSTIRQRIISSLKKGILFPGAIPNSDRWNPIRTNGKKYITVAQRIERQPHLKKHLDPKNSLKPKSLIAKYYRWKKADKLPKHEESPLESVFKNVSVDRKNKAHISRFQQDIPKDVSLRIIGKSIRNRSLENVRNIRFRR